MFIFDTDKLEWFINVSKKQTHNIRNKFSGESGMKIWHQEEREIM